jgi:hypothetical protein
VAAAPGAVPIVQRPGGPRIDIVQMGRYGVGFVDVEEVALGICRSTGLARERSRGGAEILARDL